MSLPSQLTPSESPGHVLPNLNTASTSQKRPATARMHAVSPRKKPRSNRVPLTTASDPTPTGTWLVKANIGECPPYVDHAGWVEDPSKNMLYMFGGTYPNDEYSIPTSDFYRCDTRTMKWQNLTNKLRFRDPSDPFGPIELRRDALKLPCLSRPGLTFMRMYSTSFIFIFGGYGLDEDEAVSTLIAIDVDHLEWWYVTVEGGHVAARIRPVVVAVEQKIYIFSGYGKYSGSDPKLFRSYSIACYQSARRRWTWEARDLPYSGFIPPDQVFGAGIAVYNGKKIMLTPGKLPGHDERLDFEKQKIFYFHTEHRQFQMVPHLGDYPKEVLWYSIHNFQSSSSPHPSLPYHTQPRRSLKQGVRPRESGVTSRPLPPPAIILCAWIPWASSSQYAVPEFWRLSLTQNDEIRCLNKSQHIWDLDHDFQGCASINDRIFLLGNNNPKGKESWNIHLRVILTPEDQEDRD